MHSLWAIAKNTLSQAIRMKVAVVVIVLLVVLLPLMSVVMEGDGTLLGKLQTFVSYGLGLVSLLLCILTIAVSTFTLSNDLKRRHLFLVVTKPVRRHEILAGKLLGIWILNIFLIFIFGVVIYGLTLAIPLMVDEDLLQKERVKTEFFTARTGLKVTYDEAELRKMAEQRFEMLKNTDQ
jgi:ABC-type transport system involved in multi-copper enzyme maturation permease subunit